MNNGVDVYWPAEGRFAHLDAKTADGCGISGRTIDIIEDRDGDIWISTVNEGLFRYRPSADSLAVYRHDPSDASSISQDYISVIYESHDGLIWLGTYNSGLCALDKETGRCRCYTMEKDGLSDDAIDAIAEDSYGNLWIGTVNNGLDCLNRSTDKVTNVCNSHDFHRIHCLGEFSLGELMVCSDAGAMSYRITDKGLECSNAEFSATETANVYSFLKDREGNLWFVSSIGGVEFCPVNKDFTCYKTTSGNGHNTGRTVTSICEWRDNLYFAGTTDGGIMLLDAREGKVEPFCSAFGPQAMACAVYSLVLDGSLLYAAAYNQGICVVDVEKGFVKSYMGGEGAPRVFVVMQSSNNRIYAGAADGLYRYDNMSDSFVKIRGGARVTDIEEDKNGILWIATADNGVSSYDPRSGQTKDYIGYKGEPVCNSVNAVAVDARNRVWFGTGNGLCRYDRDTGGFVNYAELNFPDENISQIIVGNDGCLWIATGNGLVAFVPETGMTRIYRHTEGLLNCHFFNNAGILSSGGQILLGTADGIALFDPDKMDDNVVLPSVAITELLINNVAVTAQTDDSPIDGPIEFTESVVLPHDKSFIGLRFACPCYSTAGNIRYRFRLDRRDGADSWYMFDGQNPVYYNLSPGKYIFRVQAASENGDWTGDTALDITVRAPLLLSAVAFVIYGLLALVLASLSVWYFWRRYRKRYRARIAGLEEQKKRELDEMKIHFFTNVAHEIRTPLSLIAGPMEYIMKDTEVKDRYEEYIDIIDRNYRRLYELVNQLLEFNKASAGGSYPVCYGNCNIADLIDRVIGSFSFAAKEKGIEIVRNYPDNMQMVSDSEAFTKIITNLIGNAVKYAEKEIEVSAFMDDGGFRMSVADDGPGVPDVLREKIFELFYQVDSGRDRAVKDGIGIGLHLVRMLVDLLGGTVDASGRSDGENGLVMSMSVPRVDSDETEIGKWNRESCLEENDLAGSQDTSHKRILVVDDNADMLSFLNHILSENYNVSLASSGEEAVEKLNSREYDLVLSDVMMAGMSGIELCAKIKSDIDTSHIFVVLLTAKTDSVSKIESLKYGVDAYIEKPFSPGHLMAQIDNLLKHYDKLSEIVKKPLSEIRQITRGNMDKEFIDRCNSLIIENMTNSEMSVDIMARELAMSRTAVFRKLKALTGMTPNDYMKFIRLNEACRMLAEGRLSITEIGYATGFSSSSYFAKCFMKQFDMLPSEFVKSFTSDNVAGNK